MASDQPQTDYSALFQQYILRSIEHVRTRATDAGSSLAPHDRELALHVLTFALDLPPAWDATRDSLISMAPQLEQAGYSQEWAAYLEKGIERSQEACDFSAEADLRLLLGILYVQRSQFEPAEKQLKTSAAQFQKLQNPVLQARALNRLAFVAIMNCHHSRADALADQAMGLVPAGHPEQAYSYFVKGRIAIDERNWSLAVEHLSQSLALREREGDERMIARSLTNLGGALRGAQRYGQAVQCFERATAIFEHIEDPVNLATVRINLGNVYLSQDRWADAVPLYEAARTVLSKLADRERLASVNTGLGIAYRHLGQWEAAERAYAASIHYRRQDGNLRRLANNLDGLGLTYLAQGRVDEALATFQEGLEVCAQIEGQPGYERVMAWLTTHMQEAQAAADRPAGPTRSVKSSPEPQTQ